MEPYLYLFLSLGALAIPLVFSFHPRIRFDREWRSFWPANVVVAAVFVAWDAAFTRTGVWGFEPRYLIGIEFFGLPLEEILFFVCIPYACVFTYFVFGTLRQDPWAARMIRPIAATMVLLLLITGLVFLDRWYTATTCLGLSAVLFAVLRKPYLGRFLLSYVVLLIPFSLINGTLTGSFIDGEVVWYDDRENSGIRLGTIPVEDVFYGMLLILLNVALFERLRRKPR